MLVGGDELHALVECYFWLGSGIDGVHLLAVYANGCDGCGYPQLVQPSQNVVKTDGFASVFFKTYDGQAPIVAYFIYEWHCVCKSTKKCRM